LSFAYGAKLQQMKGKGNEAEPAAETTVLFIDVGSHVANAGVTRFASDGSSGRVLSAVSDWTVGSVFVDRAIADHVAAEAKSKKGLDISGNAKAKARLLREAQKAKKVLSTIPAMRMDVECLADDVDISCPLSREDLNRLCASQAEAVAALATRAVNGAQGVASMAELSAVVLVGGGSYSPLFVASVEKATNMTVSRTLDSASSVAQGAALYAGASVVTPKAEIEQKGDAVAAGASDGDKNEEAAEEAKGAEAATTADDESSGAGQPAEPPAPLMASSACAFELSQYALGRPTDQDVAASASGLGDASIEAATALEARIVEINAALKRKEEARNAFEAHIYHLRDEQSRYSEQLPEELSTHLTAEEDWLFDEGEDAEEGVYTARLTALKDFVATTYPSYAEKKAAEEAELNRQLEAAQAAAAAEAAANGDDDDDRLSKDNRKMKFDERMRLAQNNKSEATELFRGNNFAHAAQRYIKATQHCEKFFDLNPEQEEEVKKLRCTLHLNIATCFVKMEAWSKAIDNCDSALKIDPTSVKGLYKKAQALIEEKRATDAYECLKQAVAIDSEDKNVRKLHDKVAKQVEAAKAKQKKAFGKMFS